MAQDGSTLNGEAAALMRAPIAQTAGKAVPAPPWLIDLKTAAAAMREHRERPPGKPFGRWLGDFLDQDTASGLLPAEEKLLFAAVAGEPCILQSRAALLWAAFEAWRNKLPEAPPEEMGFVEAMTKFTAAAPEAVQEVIIEATRHAIAKLKLPAYWEPKDAGEVEKFASAQRAYLARIEAEASPAQTVEHARTDERFFHLAAEAVSEALTPKPYEPLRLTQEWLNPLLRRDPLNLSAETRARIDAQPRALRGFFDELIHDANRAAAGDKSFTGRLKANEGVLKEYFDPVFERYAREEWRWVDPEDREVRVRARFLRFMALGGDETAPVHESRLELQGAYVGENLDLSGCAIPQPMTLARCHFAQRIRLRDAVTKSLDFSTSRVRSVDAESAHIQGGVLLEKGFRSIDGFSFPHATIEGRVSGAGALLHSGGGPSLSMNGARVSADVELADGFVGEGGVVLKGARIGGNLYCQGGAVENRKQDGTGIALDCANLDVAGDVVLSNGFRAEGAVSFSGAKIGGLVNCSGGVFVNGSAGGKGEALSFAFATIDESVWMRDGFAAEGKIRFYGAHIKGNLQLGNGRFDNAVLAGGDADAAAPRRAATAINLRAARIDGVLLLASSATHPHGQANIMGTLNLTGCRVHELVDHPSSWPSKKIRTREGKSARAFIFLDGFVYDRLMGRGDYSTATRKRWLDRQPPGDLGANFRPQPFEQLINVYREMGHEGHAREIAKFKERRRYRSLFLKLWRGWRRPAEAVRQGLRIAAEHRRLAVRHRRKGAVPLHRVRLPCRDLGFCRIRHRLLVRLGTPHAVPAGALDRRRRLLWRSRRTGRLCAIEPHDLPE